MSDRFAVVENNKVVNIVIADEVFAQAQGWITCPDAVGIEWDYIDGQFVDNRPVAPLPEIAPAQTPTKEQLMAQLLALQAQIAALP